MQTNTKRTRRRHRTPHRNAAILVWFALLLPLLLGMTGLVIDAGLLMATNRHLQNSVDAAALAGAQDLHKDLPYFQATATATEFVRSHHDLANAKLVVNIPPEYGPYAGEEDYVEVIAEFETPTIFMQMLNNVHKTRRVKARAVAGPKYVDIIDGIIALDHRNGPGLTVTGNAQLSATGRIIVNSENGGFTAEGERIPDKNGSAAFVSPFATIKASDVHVVGGVNNVDRFQNIESGGESPLRTGQLPVADPFSHVPTPTIANGVLDAFRGSVKSTRGTIQITNSSDTSDSRNHVEVNSATGEETVVLNPGIYSGIDITGGKVRFNPGIYVLASPEGQEYSLKVLDGDIQADGVMFYNTREGYEARTGRPDSIAGGQPEADGSVQGQIRINAALGFSGIDTTEHAYIGASPAISRFNGMLIYQRRKSIATIQIQGFSEDQSLSGDVYAKWGRLRLPAGGVLNSQIVVGTIAVPGHGDLFVKHDIANAAQTVRVFLVE